jgi:hypothetical protein
LHGELYRVSPFQVYCTSTYYLQHALELFMFALVKICNGYLSFYWKKWFYIWYMAFAWWLVPCLPFPGLPHIYFLFTMRLRIFHVCRSDNFVTDISASTGRNDFIFDIWLLHGDLYRVSPFQVYRTSASCLQCDLELFMFAVIETFVTDISASTWRNDFIFEIWLWHGELYRVSPFQVYCTSTSCLPHDLEFFMFAVVKICNRYLSFYWKKWFCIWYMAFAWWLVPCLPFPGLPHIYFLFTVRLRIFHLCRSENFVTDSSASTGRNDFIFDIWLLHGDLYHVSPFQVYRTYASCLQYDLEFFMFALVKIL